MHVLTHLRLASLAGYVLVQSMPMFGGEDPLGEAPGEDNWHHEGLTRRGARSAGWSDEAENSLAFHADYVDSYLYNPLWWFDLANGGGSARLPIVMSSRAELVKVHFDDLFDPEDVPAVWRRYLSGPVAALVWLGHDDSISHRDRVEMAQNAVGVSLHAIQDFYSHSNWIDDEERRSVTWFKACPEVRERLSLWTGSYERPDYLGIHPHGDYLFACTVINNLGSAGRGMMGVVCHAASPFAGSTLCRWYRECQDAVPLVPPDVVGVEPPDGILWVKPGINVDSRWQADLGVQERGLSISGAEAFETAYQLAYRNSCQWLHLLGHIMEDADLSRFWAHVTSEGVSRADYKSGTSPWEDFAKMPYRFITTGDYPPRRGSDDTASWYVRLVVRTSDSPHAGTDADIVPYVDGMRFPPLDHGVHPTPTPGTPRPSRSLLQTLMGHNDFERGDAAAYMLGPLSGPPRRISLVNDAPGVGDVLVAALERLWDAATGLLSFIGDVFLGLIGYNADFVGEDHTVIPATELESLGTGSYRAFSLRCDGGSEGDYRITGRVVPTGSTGVWSNGVPWREYRVHFSELICIAESEWDRFTNSDEPFVLGLVIPHGGRQPIQKWRTEPFSDVDTGDHRFINRDFTVRIPQRYGFISLANAVYESDSESSGDRHDLLDAFEAQASGRLTDPEETFFETLGESIAAGWKLNTLDATAFRRGDVTEVRTYRAARFDQWVDAGDRVNWNLAPDSSYQVAVPDVIGCACDLDCSTTDVPGPQAEIPRIDFRPSKLLKEKLRKRAE